METNNERVLAFTRATEIPQEELVNISGGTKFTTSKTMKPSGGSGEGLDVFVDVSIDW